MELRSRCGAVVRGLRMLGVAKARLGSKVEGAPEKVPRRFAGQSGQTIHGESFRSAEGSLGLKKRVHQGCPGEPPQNWSFFQCLWAQTEKKPARIGTKAPRNAAQPYAHVHKLRLVL